MLSNGGISTTESNGTATEPEPKPKWNNKAAPFNKPLPNWGQPAGQDGAQGTPADETGFDNQATATSSKPQPTGDVTRMLNQPVLTEQDLAGLYKSKKGDKKEKKCGDCEKLEKSVKELIATVQVLTDESRVQKGEIAQLRGKLHILTVRHIEFEGTVKAVAQANNQ